MKNPQRIRDFIARFSTLAEAAGSDERRLLDEGGRLLAELVSHDDWLSEKFARESARLFGEGLKNRRPEHGSCDIVGGGIREMAIVKCRQIRCDIAAHQGETAFGIA